MGKNVSCYSLIYFPTSTNIFQTLYSCDLFMLPLSILLHGTSILVFPLPLSRSHEVIELFCHTEKRKREREKEKNLAISCVQAGYLLFLQAATSLFSCERLWFCDSFFPVTRKEFFRVWFLPLRNVKQQSQVVAKWLQTKKLGTI